MSPPLAPTVGAASNSRHHAEFPVRYGKYVLLRRIATGGMAEIFLALHRSLAGFERLLVIKRILPSMNDDKAFINMLLQEARIAATLTHPNVVHVYDTGFVEGSYFIAMEHIDGADLRSVIRQMKTCNVLEFPLEHAISILIGTCAGLAYSHEKLGLDGQPLHIVHRDISPQNLVLTFSGDIKIVDFGVAQTGRQLGEDTQKGLLKGKAPYMSPEQVRGETIDHRTDIFAAGVILFELTTGRRLFKGQNELDTLRLICDHAYPRPSSIKPDYPPHLEAIVMRALEKGRSNRYKSAREMQQDLENFVRSHNLPVSSINTSRWMHTLFAEQLSQDREALHAAKSVADRLPQVASAEQPPALMSPAPTARKRDQHPAARVAIVAIAVIVVFALSFVIAKAGLF